MTDGISCIVAAVVILLGIAGTTALVMVGFTVLERQCGLGWAFAFLATVSASATAIVWGVMGGGR